MSGMLMSLVGIPRWSGLMTAALSGSTTGFISGVQGSMTSTGIWGGVVSNLSWNAGTSHFTLELDNLQANTAVTATGVFDALVINGVSYLTSAVSTFVPPSGGATWIWQWTTNPGLVAGNSYPVQLT